MDHLSPADIRAMEVADDWSLTRLGYLDANGQPHF